MTEDRLTTLYRRYGPAIYARCVRLLGDRVAAEDATQETFLRVQRHLHKAPDSTEALRWIYRIATNYCLNEVRDRKHRPVLFAELPDLGDDSCRSNLANRDLVAHIVRASPEKLRVPAWLHHVDGLDQGEVARILGSSRRSVVYWLAEFAAHARTLVSEPSTHQPAMAHDRPR